jgi:hypothetical protein
MKNKEINEEILIEFYEDFMEYYNKINFKSKKHEIYIRNPNFPEHISENLVRHYIRNHEKRNCVGAKSGDLCVDNLQIEIKCFASTGPTSFGPKENWDEIYFLDAIQFNKNIFKIYKCSLKNTSEIWKNIKINAKETYLNVCEKGKRPRIEFKLIKEQLKDNIKLTYEGNITNLIKYNIELNNKNP